MYGKRLIYFIIICLFKDMISSLVRVYATNEVTSSCDNGFYFLDIKVNYSIPFDKLYTFNLILENPQRLNFKCFMSYINGCIKCSLNLFSNQYDINRTEVIRMPNIFPRVKDFAWDYDSFVKNIYEKELVIRYGCKPKNIPSILSKLVTDEWGFIFNINSIYDNKCSYANNVEENHYIFNMKLEVLDGFLKKQIEKINDDKISGETVFSEIEFLQDVWVPILMAFDANGDRFIKNNEYSFAFCNTKTKITNVNINNINNEGLLFECNIPITHEQLLSGIIKIKPFYDKVYLKINDGTSNNNEIIAINMLYNIKRTIVIKDNKDNKNDESNSNRILRKIDEINNNINNTNLEDKNETETETETAIINNKENNMNNNINNNTENNNTNNNESETFTTIDYFLIGDNEKKIYCPDKPIFAIKNKRDIKIKHSNLKNYTFVLRGTLSFKYQIQKSVQEKNYQNFFLNQTQEDITFNLQVTDNLAENEDNQKTIVKCILPHNLENYYKIIHEINCYGNKISEESMERNDTDITLNWALDKNRIHDNIIIKWPVVKKKRFKNMYSYTIKAFSLSQKNSGCFNDGFYFYIYIYDIRYEPNILFEINMRSPTQPKAICKIHESSILKCFFPLYKQKIYKNTVISLPTNVTHNILNAQGNQIIFTVDEYEYDYEDFHLTMKESCGDFVVVGALRRAGLSYFMIIMGVIGIASFILVIFVCFVCYVKYKIAHRNRKGQYFAHIEEDMSGIKGKIIVSEKNKNIL